MRVEYDDEKTIEQRFDELLAQPGVEQLTALIIGAWTEAFEGGGADRIVNRLAENAAKLPELRGAVCRRDDVGRVRSVVDQSDRRQPVVAGLP